MRELSIALAKLSGIRKALFSALSEDSSVGKLRQTFVESTFSRYFKQAENELTFLRNTCSPLYSDFHVVSATPDFEAGSPPQWFYSRGQLQGLIRDIDQVFEIRANSELVVPSSPELIKKRVFITHGRSNDWREVQSYIEKDVCLETLELAQEPSQGMTIIEKLQAGANSCDSAVIVMTGDDISPDGSSRARENVMHEIGFFQGKYSRAQVILLHEDGVSIPTNLAGVVYIPFPKGTVSAGFHVLNRELQAIYRGTL